MLRIRFTAQDLLRTRFANTTTPMVDVALAVDALSGGGAGVRGVLGPWITRTRQVFPREAVPLVELVRDSGAMEYLWALDDDFDAAVDTVLSSPVRYVRESLDAVGRPGSPWVRQLAEGDHEAQEVLERAVRSVMRLLGGEHERIRATHHMDLAHRKEILFAKGLGDAVASVFGAAWWSGDALELPCDSDLEIDLAGRGMVLLPTAFRTGTTLVGTEMPGQPLTVVYPAHVPMPLLEESDRSPALTPLLGRTRTAVLKAITRAPSSTTSQIASVLGISPGRASEHAGVLRDAGLISSHRHRNTVRHVPTRLGLEIG